MNLTLILTMGGCLAGLFFLSLVETAVVRLSRVSLRVLAEREKDHEIALLEDIGRDRIRFLLPLQFAIQILTGLIAILVAVTVIQWQAPYPILLALGVMVGVIAVVRQLIPKFLTQKDPERFLLRMLPLLSGVYRLLSWLSSPIVWLLEASQKLLRRSPAVQDEATDEEIQAYLDVGEEEGIFEEQESGLIQSALEFGSTVVREIMTPRSQVVAIEDTATITELKDLMVSSKHSRIPVYRDSLEEIVGVVYVRNLLAHLEENRGNEPIKALIKKAWFVPETKRVSELLQEMQENSEPLALVVSEYGSVAGLVTIEDLIEEIVGEIYDEDEPPVVEIVPEADGALRVPGGTEIEDLEEALGVDLGDPEMTTVSGLVVAHLGEVPVAGEQVDLDGISVEVLEADEKKILEMKVRRLPEAELAPDTPSGSDPSP